MIETTGRRSGVARQTPVNALLDGKQVWLVAEAGRQADYVKNLLAQPQVRIRVGGAWRSGRASLVDDADPVELRRRIEHANGLVGRIDGLAFRAAASDMTTIRIDLDAASQ
jgi:deazaflavin-dependent oxidoreductase (nitroreductase family)